MNDLPEFKGKDFQAALKDINVSIPDNIANKIASYTNTTLGVWTEHIVRLYGRDDQKDGWSMHQKPGDFDTHKCVAFGFEELDLRDALEARERCAKEGTMSLDEVKEKIE